MKDMAEFKWSIIVVLLMLAWIYIYIAIWKMIDPIHITKLKLLYDVESTKWICGYQKAKHFFFFIKRINLKAEHELSCFIACHLGEIEASHKLIEPH